MPRASVCIADQRSSSSFRFEEGRGRIVSIHSTVGTMEFNSDKCTVIVGIQRIGRDGKATEDELVQEELAFGKLSKFHPAQATGPDDLDPEDLGTDAGVEGNAISAGDGSYFPDPKAKFSVFCASLENKGLRPSLLNCYLPNLIDLEADFTREVVKYAGMSDGNNLVVKKEGNIYNLAEINKRAGGGAPTKSTPAAAPAKKGAAPASAPPASSNGDGGGEAEIKAIEAFAALPGKKELVLTTAKVQSRLLTIMVQKKYTPTEMRDVQKVIGQPGWIAEQAEAKDWNVEGENVTIPAIPAA